MVRRNKEYKKLAGTSNLSKDAQRRAMPRGKRVSTKGWKNQYGVSDGGKVYYENRANRVDVGGFKNAYLETGGGVGKMKKPTLKKGDVVFVVGRRWFDRVNGNTYHTAEVFVNDKYVGKSRMTYGYDESYIQTAKEILLDSYELPKGMKDTSPLWQLREYGVTLNKTVSDGLKRDLEVGGSLTLTPETPLARDLGISYTGLVGETGAMSSGEMFANGGGITTNKGILETFLNSNKNLKVGNLSTHFAERENFVLLRNYGTLIAKRQGNLVTINTKKYSKTTTTITNMLESLAKEQDMEILKVSSESEFADGGYLTDPNFGDFQAGVYADGGSTVLPAGTEQHFVNYYLGEGTAQGIYAEGGGIDNQYIGKTPSEIWSMYSISQKYHFLLDHSKEIESTPMSVEKATKTAYKFLPEKIKKSFQKHIREGQYAKGGGVEDEMRYSHQIGKYVRAYYNESISNDDNGYQVNLMFYNNEDDDDYFDEEFITTNSPKEAEALADKINEEGYEKFMPKEEFAKGGGVRMVGGREYPTGRAWTNDHRHVNKSEQHEVNYKRKKSFDGGGYVVYEDGTYKILSQQPTEEDAQKFAKELASKNKGEIYGFSSIEKYKRHRAEDKKSFDGGGELEDKMQYGSWYVNIKEDENDEEIRNIEVARLIREGYFSGFDPSWYLEITDIEGDIDEATKEEIARLVEQGYTSGEVVIYKDSYAKGGGVSPFKNMMETNTITEKEINLIKLRMNNDKVDEFTQEAIDFIWDNSPQLTSDQNKKGIDYLRNLWKSPTGKERANNPFGYREEEALETFEYFELRGFYDAGNRYRKFYVPLYTCVGAETSFEYYMSGGGINIVG
jgi:hypothetical protein